MSAPLWRRLLLVGGGRTTTATTETDTVQRVQAKFSDLELQDGLRSMQQFGIASALPTGTDLVVVFVGGDRGNGVAVASNHQSYRPTGLKEGEVQIYDSRGRSVLLGANGIVVNGGGEQITLTNTPKVRVEADLEATGEVIAHADSGPVHVTTHTHGGVKAGGDPTAAPNAGS